MNGQEREIGDAGRRRIRRGSPTDGTEPAVHLDNRPDAPTVDFETDD